MIKTNDNKVERRKYDDKKYQLKARFLDILKNLTLW